MRAAVAGPVARAAFEGECGRKVVMRNVLNLFRPVRQRSASSRPPNGGWYRSESGRPLSVGRALRSWQSRFTPGVR